MYETFFKDYAQKVWGKPCNQISAQWGTQRIKSLDISKALLHAIKSTLGIKGNKVTTLIEEFLYPQYGPGQLWKKSSHMAIDLSAELKLNTKLTKIYTNKNKVVSIEFKDLENQTTYKINTNYLISSIPIRELANAIEPKINAQMLDIASGL